MKNEKAYLKKFVYNEIDEEELYIKEKSKVKKVKPKKKEFKPHKGNKNLSTNTIKKKEIIVDRVDKMGL